MNKQKKSFSPLKILIIFLVLFIIGGTTAWYMCLKKEDSVLISMSDTSLKTSPFNRNEAYILLRMVDNPNRDIQTAFSLYAENYLCLNTQESPVIKNEQQQNNFSSSKEIYCGNYYIIEQYNDATGPLLYGPFYNGEIDTDICYQEDLSDACHFVKATRSNDIDICKNIKDHFWQEKCSISVALNTRDIKICSNISEDFRRECYENFNRFFERTDKLCEELDSFDNYLGSNCYRDLSVIQKDILVCDKIKEDWARDKCIMEPIIWEHVRDNYTNLDKIDCNKIKDEENKGRCFVFMKENFSE